MRTCQFILLAAVLQLAEAHFQLTDAIVPLKTFFREINQRIQYYTQAPSLSCSISDGPTCFGIDNLKQPSTVNHQAQVGQDLMDNIKHNTALLSMSNEQGAGVGQGIKMLEAQMSFMLSFVSYNDLTFQDISPRVPPTNASLEPYFELDHLSETALVKEMGQGSEELVITYDNPIMITSRYDEDILQPENFTNPKVAIQDGYPTGAFGYTQTYPMRVGFQRPVEFISVFFKKHRDPNFYLKSSGEVAQVQGYLQGHLVFNCSILVFNTQWRKFQFQSQVVVDKIVVPPGIDMDNLLVQVGEGVQDIITVQQLGLLPHKTQWLQKVYTVDSGRPKPSRSQQDQGFNLMITEPTYADPEFSQNLAKDLAKKAGLSDSFIQKLETIDQGDTSSLIDLLGDNDKFEIRVIAIFQQPNYLEEIGKKYKGQKNRKQLVDGEAISMRSNTFLYFTIDMLTFFEIGSSSISSQLTENDFHFGKVFTEIGKLENRSKDKITKIILEGLHAKVVKPQDISRYVDILMNYLDQLKDAKKATKAETEAAKKHTSNQLTFLRSEQNAPERMKEDRMFQYFRDYALGRISFEHYAECLQVYFVQNFRKYGITVKRLETGVTLLKEAGRVQGRAREQRGDFTKEEKDAIQAIADFVKLPPKDRKPSEVKKPEAQAEDNLMSGMLENIKQQIGPEGSDYVTKLDEYYTKLVSGAQPSEEELTSLREAFLEYTRISAGYYNTESSADFVTQADRDEFDAHAIRLFEQQMKTLEKVRQMTEEEMADFLTEAMADLYAQQFAEELSKSQDEITLTEEELLEVLKMMESQKEAYDDSDEDFDDE